MGGFEGKRILSLESRRATETAELVRRNQGDPFVAPSMREVPIEENQAALEFADKLAAGKFDMVILLTGVGTRFLARLVGPKLVEGLRRVTTVARGPKPVAALRELGLSATIIVPEPNTWREILSAIEGRPERRIAVQEYGRPATELVDELRRRGAEVTTVPVYQWALPSDTGPLEEAARDLAGLKFDQILLTSSVQIEHLLEVAERLNIRPQVEEGLRKTAIGSIGPTTSETLVELGFPPAFEASHPKLGYLVKEAAEFRG